MPKQRTKKGEIALKFINKYNGTMQKRSLAKLLHDKHPELFKSIEDARSIIRKYTFSSGNKILKDSVQWDIPEGDKNPYEDFIMPLSSSKLLILSDVHFPFHCKHKLEKALEYGQINGCNAIYFNGDSLDFYKGSRYDQDRSYKDLYEEVEFFKIFLDGLKKNFDVPMYFKIGNHEERWERMLRENPQFDMFDEFKLSSILQFGKYGITEVKSKQETRCGKFSIWHGHEFHGSGGINPAKWLFERTMRSGVCGHFHRISEHRVFNGTEWIENYSLGTLGDLRPAFLPHQKANMTWDASFGILEWDKTSFEFQNIRLK